MAQDNELLEFDRINVIKDTIKKYGEDNFYLSFSGGKDSTILHYLIDMALPNNKIPRVFINTGIEFVKIVEFVTELAKKDTRFVIVKPSQPIKRTLDIYGYPFKSKEHSQRVDQFNKGHNSNFIKKYLGKTDYKGKFMCPKMLLYQFEERGKNRFKISKEKSSSMEQRFKRDTF